ncbi:helicase tegument protein [Glossina pallidipes salivary gland hypertrophy virus]|uniref:Helicase tegument protein n=1 Tax=Glossina hytrovirus (isolate Glossina pallidipes/Ethiopia/Seibersdorf/-) TaxID=379529 RepID=A0A0Y0GFM3_GHVS|nr:helicase tegument protein [Glossina pallidipes salivary gland hypertrophy virus]
MDNELAITSIEDIHYNSDQESEGENDELVKETNKEEEEDESVINIMEDYINNFINNNIIKIKPIDFLNNFLHQIYIIKTTTLDPLDTFRQIVEKDVIEDMLSIYKNNKAPIEPFYTNDSTLDTKLYNKIMNREYPTKDNIFLVSKKVNEWKEVMKIVNEFCDMYDEIIVRETDDDYYKHKKAITSFFSQMDYFIFKIIEYVELDIIDCNFWNNFIRFTVDSKPILQGYAIIFHTNFYQSLLKSNLKTIIHQGIPLNERK